MHLKGSGICGDFSQTIYGDVQNPSPLLVTLSKVLSQLQQAAIEDIEDATVAIGLDPLPIIMNKVKSEEGRSGEGEGGRDQDREGVGKGMREGSRLGGSWEGTGRGIKHVIAGTGVQVTVASSYI